MDERERSEREKEGENEYRGKFCCRISPSFEMYFEDLHFVTVPFDFL